MNGPAARWTTLRGRNSRRRWPDGRKERSSGVAASRTYSLVRQSCGQELSAVVRGRSGRGQDSSAGGRRASRAHHRRPSGAARSRRPGGGRRRRRAPGQKSQGRARQQDLVGPLHRLRRGALAAANHLWQFVPDPPDARLRRDAVRDGSRSADDSARRPATPKRGDSFVLRRLARPLGGQHTGRRNDEHSRGFEASRRVGEEPAADRALHAHRARIGSSGR